MGTPITDRATQGLATRLATRTSRRGFLGHVGRVALTVAGGTAIMALLPSAAGALLQCDCAGPACNHGCSGNRHCDCEDQHGSQGHCGHSVTCLGLTGSGCPATGGTGGTCPPNSHPCGSWACTCAQCTGGVRIWTDCCDDTGSTVCDPADSATCICDVDGIWRPRCTYKHCYTGGGGGCNFIRCRYETC
jgi:hypothetical protein